MTWQLSISQTKYPKKAIWDGDTVVVITPSILSVTNSIIEERNVLKYELLPELEDLCELQDSLIANQALEISTLQNLNMNAEMQLKGLQQFEEKQRETWGEERKRLKRQQWLVGGCCTGLGLVLGLVLGLH